MPKIINYQYKIKISIIFVTALGALYSKANSPKASPSLYVFKWTFSPSYLNFLKQFNSPESITYKWFPSSPYLITVSPAL